MLGLAQGDLGESISNRRPVIQDLKVFSPATLELTLAFNGLLSAAGAPLGHSGRGQAQPAG